MFGMQKGGRRLLIVPPSMGYGSKYFPKGVLHSSTLVLAVEVHQVGSVSVHIALYERSTFLCRDFSYLLSGSKLMFKLELCCISFVFGVTFYLG